MGQRGVIKSPEADSVAFDPETTSLASETAGEAIRELYFVANGTSKGYTFAQYNGNANTGRYLEFFEGISSDAAPLFTNTAVEILTIVSRTTATDSTCTIGFYNLAGGGSVLLHTTTFSNQKQVLETGNPVFSVPAGAELAIKIDSGSITKPHLYFVLKGA